MLKAAEEYANFGALCAEIVASSTRLKENAWISLKVEFTNYIKAKNEDPGILEDTRFDAYFLSFIELRRLYLLKLLKESLTKNPSFLERQEIYYEIQKSFDTQLTKKHSISLIKQNKHMHVVLDELLKKHGYNMFETMEDFFALAQKEYRIKEDKLYKDFFTKETTGFEKIVKEAWNYLIDSPNEFKENHMLIQALIILLFITSLAIFMFIYIPTK